MTKPVLSSLTSIVPTKGEAGAKAETLPDLPDPQDLNASKKVLRNNTTVRLIMSDDEELRLMAFKERVPKQSLIDVAIREFLVRRRN